MIWNIWKERNPRIFEDKCKPIREVIDVIVRDVSNWLVDTKEFNNISMTDLICDWKTCIMLNVPTKEALNGRWQPPPFGRCKLNFDGASKGNPELSGFACVVRDFQGDLIKIVAGPIGFADSTKAEVMGLLWGLREIHSLKLVHVLVEGDSTVVVG